MTPLIHSPKSTHILHHGLANVYFKSFLLQPEIFDFAPCELVVLRRYNVKILSPIETSLYILCCALNLFWLSRRNTVELTG